MVGMAVATIVTSIAETKLTIMAATKIQRRLAGEIGSGKFFSDTLAEKMVGQARFELATLSTPC